MASNNIEIKINKILNSEGVKFFLKRVVRDANKLGKDTRESIAKIKNSELSKSQKLNEVIQILYQVRCNLFHGNKLFFNDSDMEIVRNAADVLAVFLKTMMGKVKI